MMKYLLIAIAFIGICYSYSYNNYYDFVYSNLIQHETQWTHEKDGNIVTSPKGAVGIGQLMPIVLTEYNNQTGGKYRKKDLKSKKINLKISKWYFFQYLYLKYNGDIIKMVNSYNMGPNNTDKGKYNFNYISDIVPIEFSYFIRNKEVIRFYENIWILSTP